MFKDLRVVDSLHIVMLSGDWHFNCGIYMTVISLFLFLYIAIVLHNAGGKNKNTAKSTLFSCCCFFFFK